MLGEEGVFAMLDVTGMERDPNEREDDLRSNIQLPPQATENYLERQS
jgi:hypothetical protein